MSAFKIDDNTFDIDTNILAQSFGGDKFTIPLPPLLSDKKLYIGAEDIEKISQYIGG